MQFDSFISQVSSAIKVGSDSEIEIGPDGISLDEAEYLNVCRYLGKLMCCFLAEKDFPVPIRLSTFAINRADDNGVRFDVLSDQTYLQIHAFAGQTPYAAHEGVTAQVCLDTFSITRFESAVSFGPVRIAFDFVLTAEERQELERDYPDVVIGVLNVVRTQLAG